MEPGFHELSHDHGDRLYTDNDGRAELETGNIAIRMAPNTDLSTTTLSDRLLQLGLAQGTLRVRAYDIYPRETRLKLIRPARR